MSTPPVDNFVEAVRTSFWLAGVFLWMACERFMMVRETPLPLLIGSPHRLWRKEFLHDVGSAGA